MTNTEHAELGLGTDGGLESYTGHLLRRAQDRANAIGRDVLPAADSPRRFAVLTALADHGAASQRQLCDLLHLNRTLMVAVIDELESAGLLTRQRGTLDRRANALSLTPAGSRSVASLRRAVEQGDAVLTAALHDDERSRLNRYLQAMLAEPGLGSLPVLAGCTAFLLTRAHHQLRERGRDALSTIGIEPRHFGALAALSQGEPCSQQQLAQRLGVTPPVIVAIVDDLEREQLITRTRRSDDRRAYDVALTPDGRSRLADAHARLGELQRDISRLLGTEAHAELRRLLAAIAEQ